MINEMKITFKYVVIIMLVLPCMLTHQACKSDKVKDIPDVSEIEIELKVVRFEKDLFSLDTNNIEIGLKSLKEKYPEFTTLYITRIIGTPELARDPILEQDFIRKFITNRHIRDLYNHSMTLYNDFSPFLPKFEDAFKRIKYFFPEREVPTLTTFISEFTYGNIIYGQNDLGIGLDFFLGSNYPYGKIDPSNPAFSDYLVRSFNKEHLVMKSLKPWVEDIVGAAGPNLLDHMVQHGKQLYILQQLLPTTPDSILIEYTSKQMNWCSENELNIWSHFISEDLLYSTNLKKTRKYISYSPNAPGMPPEAPGRTGDFIGWKIIASYMDRHPDATLADLLQLTSGQDVLEGARYKPKRK